MPSEKLDYSRHFWQGEKVRLRPLCENDAERFFIDSLDSPSRQFLEMGAEMPTSPELLREALKPVLGCKANSNGVIVLAIEEIAGGMVGAISLHSRDLKNGTFGFGISIARPHRRKGYAEDATRIMLKYAFHEQRYQKCNSACLSSNKGSIALHRRMGFVEEGRRRRHVFMNGEFHDEMLFGMTREEFDEMESKRPVG